MSLAIRRIDFHGIAAQLAEVPGVIAGWPAEALAFIDDARRMQALWEATHAPLVASAIGALADAGVPTLVLKGTALAYGIWPRPELRQRSDSDLMIDPSHVERARATLVTLGWQAADRETFQETWVYTQARGFRHQIDLHWRMRNMLDEPAALAFAPCFARSVALPRLHPSARACDPATTLINCSLNHLAHRVYGYRSLDRWNEGEVHLGGVADTRRIVDAMAPEDWSALIALCADARVAAPVAEALDLAAEWLTVPIPGEPLCEMRALAAAQASEPAPWVVPPTRGSAANFVARLRAARGSEAKLAVVRRRLWPPPHVLGLDAEASSARLMRARIGRLLKHAAAPFIPTSRQ